MKPTPATTRLVWLWTLLLSAIGVAAVVRRMLQLLSPSPAAAGLTAAAALDADFARHPVLTMVHIVPGLLFVTLGPLQFVRRLRTSRPRLHRWMGRVALASGVILGATALVMSPQAIGGANETAATILFAILFLFALGKAFAAIRREKSRRTGSG